MQHDDDPADDEMTAAVRRYLEFVADPDSARDEALIASIEASIARETDVITRLRLLSDLERAKQIDGSALLDGFVVHARTWAEQNRITVSALKTVGVSAVVLAEAGFDLGHGSIHDRQARTPKPAIARAPRQASPAGGNVSASTVKAWVGQQPGQFTIAEGMAGVGASLMTVKKAITDMMSEGTVRSHGHIARPGVRGRAPEHFSVVRP